ncbi:MAG: ATP-binding protein [Planctomycetota bacterium]
MSHPTPDESGVAGLTPRYVAALGLLAALALGSFIALQTQFQKQTADGIVVNVAGKQRMLSQRAPRLLLEILTAPTVEAEEVRRGQLLETIALMRADHRALVDGDVARGIPAEHSLEVSDAYGPGFELDARVMDFLAALDELASLDAEALRSSPALRRVLDESRMPLLRDLNEVVGFHEAAATAGVRRVQVLEAGILVLTLLTLAGVGAFLFRPMVHRLRAQVDALVARERDMALVLENTQDGFVLVTSEGEPLSTCSRNAREWFGDPETAPDVGVLLFADDVEKRKTLELGWSELQESFMPLEVVLDQLPSRIQRGDRTLRLQYQPVFAGEELTHVLVVADDLTERIALERAEQRSRAIQSFIGFALRDPEGTRLFAEDIERLLEDVLLASDAPMDRGRALRGLHTVKGNSAVFGLRPLADRAHAIENALEDPAPGYSVRGDILTLRAEWRALMTEAEGFLGSKRSGIAISETDFDALVSRLDELGDHELLSFVRAWRYPRLSALLLQLERQAQRIAASLGVEIDVEIDLEGGSDRVDLTCLRTFSPNLVHALRNALDHGIEPAAERLERGKPARASLELSARASGGSVVIEIADDGRGVDWERVRERARAFGLPSDTEDELTRALLHDGLTTRDTVTATAGRGIGMAALRREVEQLDGRIELDSHSGQGTRWRFVLPIGQEDDRRAAA